MGAWADYQTVRLEGGQRTEDVTRVQCVGRAGGPEGAWQLELLPLQEQGSGRAPVPGEGWALDLSPRLARREGELSALVERVVKWHAGTAMPLAPAEWREDPLVASSLRTDFRPQRVSASGTTTRVVDARDLLCDQLVMSAADTLRVALPRGTMEQVTTREISAATSAAVPFLGLAFVAERTVSAGRIDPPSPDRRLPPPTVRVETMELLGFGGGARRALAPR